jgi:hypothetical protein
MDCETCRRVIQRLEEIIDQGGKLPDGKQRKIMLTGARTPAVGLCHCSTYSPRRRPCLAWRSNAELDCRTQVTALEAPLPIWQRTTLPRRSPVWWCGATLSAAQGEIYAQVPSGCCGCGVLLGKSCHQSHGHHRLRRVGNHSFAKDYNSTVPDSWAVINGAHAILLDQRCPGCSLAEPEPLCQRH